ncbi:efflux transporter outer membrane subunit [Polaromonas sp.]|uniref:efflux transporter outer membrane subunit n=1 Tax=Polaromonas sp. TaxID=1869339 RepID=UPI002FC72182
MRKLRLIALSCVPFWLAACATQGPPASVSAPPAAQWQAPLPHQGTLTDLSQWWQQHKDPLLVALIEAAQAASPSVASARSRIELSRATRVTAGAALLPSLDASLSATRSRAQMAGAATPPAITTTAEAHLQASWELDLFGGRQAARDAAQARFEGAQAQWHDARVSVAAEVANQYYSLRTCHQLLTVARADALSRAETARLSDLSAQAGFTAPATAALARASAAEGNSLATQQRARCDLDIKALVALTAWTEPDLREKMAVPVATPAQEAPISIASVPAQALAQRPDVFNAEREVHAASADVGHAQVQRYPHLSLSGSVGSSRIRSRGVTQDFSTWSFGPLTLAIPLFDGGAHAAELQASRARYEEAVAQYRGTVRQAVREVEEALVNLDSTGSRQDDARVAAENYRASFTGTEARYKSGLASLVELEDARRTRLAAETSLLLLQRERLTAWVALYRAVGGGWDRSAPVAAHDEALGTSATPAALPQ